MLNRVMQIDPLNEMRAMDEMFNRLFAEPFGNRRSGATLATLPVDILERDNKLIVRAAVPGVRPEDLDVAIENNVLTIRGESRDEHESNDEKTKVYRREVSFGSFARSIRLPERLKLDDVDAEFKNGFVTITIPKAEEPKPEAKRISVRSAEADSGRQIPASTETKPG